MYVYISLLVYLMKVQPWFSSKEAIADFDHSTILLFVHGQTAPLTCLSALTLITQQKSSNYKHKNQISGLNRQI